MLFYGCFNIGISGPLTQYSKTFPKFSRCAELQPLRASRTLSFPQMQYHPTADTNGRSRVVGVPVYADWNAPFLFFVAFLAELD